MNANSLPAACALLAAALLPLAACSSEKQPASAPSTTQPASRPASAPASQPVSAPAVEPVDLLGPGLKSGSVWSHTEKILWQGVGKLQSTHGAEQNGLAAMQHSLEQHIEVLVVTETGLPVSARVEHQRVQTVFDMSGDQSTWAAPLVGKTLDYKYDDDGACSLIVTQQPAPKKKKRGKAEVAEEDDSAKGDLGCPSIPHLLYPATPVKPGDGWSPPVDAVRLALGVEKHADLVLKSNRMTLQKVEDGSERVAKIVWELQAAITKPDKTRTEYAVRVEIRRSLTRYLDLETRWQGRLVDEAPVMDGLLKMEGNFTMTARNEPAVHAATIP